MTEASPHSRFGGLLRSDAFIDGRWWQEGDHFSVLDPATTASIADVVDAGSKGAHAAVDAADKALADWRARPARERSTFLHRWADLMREHREPLACLVTAEQGKPIAEARAEVDYSAAYLQWFGEQARRADGRIITPHEAGRHLLVRKTPVGIVAAITPWNFPLAMITRKAGPALAAGCTMVLKPSELTPLSALALAALGEEAGIPAGVFNVVTGAAPAIGRVLIGDARVRKLSFTGSTTVGKTLAADAMATVKRVSLELGGNAPLIIFDDADIETAIAGTLAAKFRNAGQTCVAANRIYVAEDIYDLFAARLAERVHLLNVGAGTEDGVEIGPLIDQRAVAKVAAHVAEAVQGGARVLANGEAPDLPGYFTPPILLGDVSPAALLCREETFGPAAALIRFRDEADVVALANQSSAGLAAYAFTSNLDRSWRVPQQLDYGMVGLNTGMISSEVVPFGGIKEAGLGREGSVYGLDEYLDIRLVTAAVGS